MALFGKKKRIYEETIASIIADGCQPAKAGKINTEESTPKQSEHTEPDGTQKKRTHIAYEDNTAEFTEIPKENVFAALQEKAAKMFSTENLIEKTGNKHFAAAFNALLSLPEKSGDAETEKAIKKLQKAAGDAYSGKVDKFPYLLFGHALAVLYDRYYGGSWFVDYLTKIAERNINVDLFFALPAVAKKIEYRANSRDAHYMAILAMLIIQQYGYDFNKEKLAYLADRMDYVFANGCPGNYSMKMTPARLHDIANGLYDNIFESIRKFRSLARSAEKAGNTEDAAGYYFEAAKLADFSSIRDYLRLSTDLNRDIADTGYKSKDYEFFHRCWKAADKCSGISEKLAALQPAMDICYPQAFTVASVFCENAGDAEKSLELHEKALRLAETDALNKDFSLKDSALFAKDTDRYMHFAFLEIAQVIRRNGRLSEGFNIAVSHSRINEFFEMMMTLCATPNFLGETEAGIPQLDDGQKRIIFAWVFRNTFDKRFKRYGDSSLAHLFASGFGTPVNKEAALRIWKNNIIKDRNGAYPYTSCDAAYFVGRAYLLADGAERDKEKAVEYLNIAILSGYGSYTAQAKKLLELSDKTPDGLSNEGVAYYRSGEYKKALWFFEAAAQFGSGIGCRNAGVCYYKGQGTEKDVKKANAYFRMGANDDIQCAFNAGTECEDEKDYVSARVYFEKAAAMKEPADSHTGGKAMLHLASLYYDGKITGKKDTLHYLYYMQKAIASGVAVTDGQKECYAGTSPDSYELMMAFNKVKLNRLADGYAAFVLERAVKADIVGAQQELGIRYYTGLGVSVDKDRAFYLLTRAKAGIHTDMCEYYLACWSTDKALDFYLDNDIHGFFDALQKAIGLLDGISDELDDLNRRGLILALRAYSDFSMAFVEYDSDEDSEDDISVLEGYFERAKALLLKQIDEYPKIAFSMLFEIYVTMADDAICPDEKEKESRNQSAYTYLYRGVSAGAKKCKRIFESISDNDFYLIAHLFTDDNPEIALFYLNRINETDVDAMATTGGIYKIHYKNYQKALYYFDKALRGGSDDNNIQREIGFPFDENRDAVPNPYGLSTSQQVAYLRMSAANGCESAKKILSIYIDNGFI